MKRKTYILTGVAVLAVAALYFGVFRSAGASVPASALYEVQRADLEDVVTSLGKLEPATYVDVGAQVSGQTQQLHGAPGSQGMKGGLAPEIAPRPPLPQVGAD